MYMYMYMLAHAHTHTHHIYIYRYVRIQAGQEIPNSSYYYCESPREADAA